jgi:hypothetical protein
MVMAATAVRPMYAERSRTVMFIERLRGQWARASCPLSSESAVLVARNRH